MLSMYLTWETICEFIHKSSVPLDVSNLLSENENPERVLTRNPARLSRIILTESKDGRFPKKELLAVSNGKDLKNAIKTYLASSEQRNTCITNTCPFSNLLAPPEKTMNFGYFLARPPKKEILFDEELRFEPDDPIFLKKTNKKV